MNVFVGRQPILTADKKVFGYELLFRSGWDNAFPACDGDLATSQLLSNTFFSEGVDTILGGKPGFVNFTKNLIRDKIPLVFSKDQVFIEVLEDVGPSPEVVEALREFKKKGFVIVLDDFIYEEKLQAFMDICDIIKIDLLKTPLKTIEPLVDDILGRGNITLLAEKVESHEVFMEAKEKGFQLFQGYFFARPEVILQKGLTVNQLNKLRLLAETRKSDPDLGKIRKLIKVDVSLSFKLLKLINSSYFRRRSPINTIKDAMIVMGTENLMKFVNLAIVGDISTGKPNELVRLSIIRASLCEQIGKIVPLDFTSDELFTVGLFSLMDAMLDIRMEEFVRQVSFSKKMTTALLGKSSQVQEILDIVLACERMDQHLTYIFSDRYQGVNLMSFLPQFYQNAVEMADAIYPAK